MNATKTDRLSETLANVLTSPNVSDSNGEAANLVDVFDEISRCLWFAFAPERGMKRVRRDGGTRRGHQGRGAGDRDRLGWGCRGDQ